jgi:hypothetical protein
VLGGSDDPLVPVVDVRLLAALIPHSELRFVDCGHMLLLTRTREAAATIRRFLAGEKESRHSHEATTSEPAAASSRGRFLEWCLRVLRFWRWPARAGSAVPGSTAS